MLGVKLFKERAAVAAGRSIYAAAVAQARRPAFYLDGVADTPEGRFELYAAHVILLMSRLKGRGEEAAETSQALFDAFVQGLDDGLRDMGVGDLSVGRKMRKLGEAVYGRAKSYEAALGVLPDCAPLEALVGRTLLQDGDAAAAPKLAGYIAKARDSLAAQPTTALLAGEARWPEFSA